MRVMRCRKEQRWFLTRRSDDVAAVLAAVGRRADADERVAVRHAVAAVLAWTRRARVEDWLTRVDDRVDRIGRSQRAGCCTERERRKYR